MLSVIRNRITPHKSCIQIFNKFFGIFKERVSAQFATLRKLANSAKFRQTSPNPALTKSYISRIFHKLVRQIACSCIAKFLTFEWNFARLEENSCRAGGARGKFFRPPFFVWVSLCEYIFACVYDSLNVWDRTPHDSGVATFNSAQFPSNGSSRWLHLTLHFLHFFPTFFHLFRFFQISPFKIQYEPRLSPFLKICKF